MKFNLVPLILASAQAEAPADFASLKAETENMKSQFLHESQSIDAKLRSIVNHKPKVEESLVQLESTEEMKRHRHQFEEESATLLEANKARVDKYRERFDQLLSKLREDVSNKNYGSSFVEMSQEPLDVDRLFAETKAKVDKLHFISRDIREVVNHWKKGDDVPPPPLAQASFDNIEV